MKKLVSIIMSVVMPISMLLTPQVGALAADDNIPASVQEQFNEMTELRKEAIADYQKYANSRAVFDYEERPVFRVLLIEGRNVVGAKGTKCSATEEDDLIFSKVPEQFENLFEYLTDFKIDMQVDTLIIDDVITMTDVYPCIDDVAFIFDKYIPYGKYDSVLTLIPENKDCENPCSGLCTIDPYAGCGYGWSPIMDVDHEEIRPGIHENEDFHYYTTDVVLHEWMHELESFAAITVNDEDSLFMPSADIAGLLDEEAVVLNEDETKFRNSEYEWDNVWPEDTVRGHSKEYYVGGDIKSISYSRAFLTGALYNIEKQRYVGMFPAFWKFYNNKFILGEYYGYNDEGFKSFGESFDEVHTTKYPDYKDNGYIWRLYYSIWNDEIGITNKNFDRLDYCSNLSENPDITYTRISFNSEGDYYIINSSNQKYLCVGEYDRQIGATMMTFSDYKDDDSIRWTISYDGDNFVRITSKTNPNLMFDINNNRDWNDNIVELYRETGYPTAQSFQLRLNLDDTYSIYPLLSVQRCVSEKDGKVVLNPDNKTPEQKWQIVKVEDVPEEPVTTTEPVATTTEPIPTTTMPAATTTEPVSAATTTISAATETAPAVTSAEATTAPSETPTEPVTEPPVSEETPGDVNRDGLIDASDASEVLLEYARIATGAEPALSKYLADVNGDGRVDSADASLILAYYTNNAVGEEISFADFIRENL